MVIPGGPIDPPELEGDEDIEDDENEESDDEEPFDEPECPVVGTEDDNGIECEFEVREGSWWCTTHTCWA